MYTLRYSNKNILIELTELSGDEFYKTTYFEDAFKEYIRNHSDSEKPHYFLPENASKNFPIKPKKSDLIQSKKILTNYSTDNDITLQDIEDYEMNKSQEIHESKVTVQRLVRDSKISRNLKNFYDNTCSVCETKLRKSDGSFYSEAHHIQPYNKIHQGTDSSSNLIVLCSNCHTQFDDLYYAINPTNKKLYCLFEDDKNHLKDLNLKHKLDEVSLEYAWQLHLLKKHTL